MPTQESYELAWKKLPASQKAKTTKEKFTARAKKSMKEPVQPKGKERLTIERRLGRKYPGMYKKHASAVKKAKERDKEGPIGRLKRAVHKYLTKDKKENVSKKENVRTKGAKQAMKRQYGVDWEKDRPTARLKKGKR